MISSAVLQIIALITMTVDHIGLYFFSDIDAFRIVGRLAFPLFAFLLVEGFKHTRSRKKYFWRIVLAGIVAEFPNYLLAIISNVDYSHNVMFTLAFALTTLCLAERGGWSLVAVPIIALVAGVLNCDYGTFGVLLILGFYYADRIFAKNRIVRLLADGLVLSAMMMSLTQYEKWGILNYGMLGIIPIMFYSGKKGRRLPGKFSYIYYPAHLLVILLVKLMLY
jgi:hypothetical protein